MIQKNHYLTPIVNQVIGCIAYFLVGVGENKNLIFLLILELLEI